MKKKSETSCDMETTSQEEATFQCEHCANSFKTENGLKIHIGKSHKALKANVSPEKVRDNTLETSLTVSPARDTRREEKETEDVEKAQPLLEEQIVQRHFSVESICNLSRLKERFESDLDKDIVKYFEVHEQEKLSDKMTRFEIIIKGVKGSKVLWPKGQDVCKNVTMMK